MKFQVGETIVSTGDPSLMYEVVRADNGSYDLKHTVSGTMYKNHAFTDIDPRYESMSKPKPEPKQIVPGTPLIYLGGLKDADDLGYEVGHKYQAEIFQKNGNCYLVAKGNKADPNNYWIVLRNERGEQMYTTVYFKIDDGTEFAIAPTVKCNCHQQFTPKGCSSWCNTQPEKKRA